MKTKSPSQFPFRNLRTLIGLVLCLGLYPAASALAQAPQQNSGIQVGQSYHNDVSPALRDMPHSPLQANYEHDGNEDRKLPVDRVDKPDPVAQNKSLPGVPAPNIPAPILNFDGISCAGCGARPN